MAEKTTYYGLTKPTPEDFYNVSVQNENMDIIDEALGDTAPRWFTIMLNGDSTNGYTINKTFAEITTAFSEGRDLRLLEYGSSMFQYKLVQATASKAYFAYSIEDDAAVVMVDKNENVTKTTFAFLKAGHDYSSTAHSDIRNDVLTAMTSANNAMGAARGAQSTADAAVPKTRTVNGKALSSNITLSASDVGASATGHKHTKSEITDFPTSMTPTAHNQAASTITAGTFAGQVVANASGQAVGTSLLRNSKLVNAETNPTVNGEICWTYE